ncbi:MAG: cytochrome c [Halofilum sp. (in: g-proteobacteria)]
MQRISAIIMSAVLAAAATNAQAAGNPAAGKEKAQTCAECHGERGNTSNSMYPKLAGQHESYLLQSMKDYQTGDRDNQIMAGMISNMSEQDLADLAAYFARQDGLRKVNP